MTELEICGYKPLKALGSGAFGQVYELDNKQALKYTALPYKCAIFSEEFVNSYREITVLRGLSHPGIANYNKVILSTDGLGFVSKLANKDLFSFIYRCRGNTNLDAVALQLCQAVKYLHDRNILHRDIKPANILVYDKRVAFTDFGASTVLMKDFEHKESYICSDINVTTWIYAAPELLVDKHNFVYTKATDVWALGLTLYELYTNKLFFPNAWNTYNIMSSKISSMRPQKVAKKLYKDINNKAVIEFLLHLIDFDHETRWTMEQVMQSDFIKNLDVENKEEERKIEYPLVSIKTTGSVLKYITKAVAYSKYYKCISCDTECSNQLKIQVEWLFVLVDLIYRTSHLCRDTDINKYCFACLHIIMIYYGYIIEDDNQYILETMVDECLITNYVNIILKDISLIVDRRYLYPLCTNYAQVNLLIDNVLADNTVYNKVDRNQLKVLLNKVSDSPDQAKKYYDFITNLQA